jgi:hypothetical protein
MRIEIQAATEGVLHHHNQHANTVSGLHPLLYYRGSERGHIMEQMAVLLKDWPQLDYFGQLLTRSHEHRSLSAPLLDAILPILEYTPEQLECGGFMEDWLAAALRAHVRIKKAAALLEPLGIHESDICLLLRDRMNERLRFLRKRLRKSKHE